MTRRHNISPIEVKSSRSYSTVSLDKFKVKFAQQLAQPYVLHAKTLEEKNGVIYLPIYMASLVGDRCVRDMMDRDKVKGMLWGLVVGDCHGSPVQFSGKDDHPWITEMMPC